MPSVFGPACFLSNRPCAQPREARPRCAIGADNIQREFGVSLGESLGSGLRFRDISRMRPGDEGSWTARTALGPVNSTGAGCDGRDFAASEFGSIQRLVPPHDTGADSTNSTEIPTSTSLIGRQRRSVAGYLRRLATRAALRALEPRILGLSAKVQVRRILVSGSMGIGNAVMLEPLLHALRERFPSAHLAVTVSEDAPSLALLRWPGLVDEVIIVRAKGRLESTRVGLRLARRRWDLCVIRFNGITQELVTAMVFGRIPYRVGHVSSGRFHSNMDWLFNLPVTMGDYDHEVDRYLALAERLGQIPSRREPSLWLRDDDIRTAVSALQDLGLTGDQRVVAIQAGTSAHQAWKRWPPEHWRVLVGALINAGFAVVAFGSKDERNLVDQICSGTSAVNAAGICSLRVAAAILARCKVLICTDSGLMHIAAAVGTPTVSLFGPTDRTRTRPRGARHTILGPASCRGNAVPCLSPMGILASDCTWRRCMASITPQEVLSALQSHLGPSAPAS